MLKRRKARALSSLQDRQAALELEQPQMPSLERAELQPAHSRLGKALQYKSVSEIRGNIFSTCAILAAFAATEYLGATLVGTSFEGREWLCLLPALAVFGISSGCLLTYLHRFGLIKQQVAENLLPRGLYVATFDHMLSDPPKKGMWAKLFARPLERMLSSDSLVKRITALVEFYPRLAGKAGLRPLPLATQLERLVLGFIGVSALSIPLLLTLIYWFVALASNSYHNYPRSIAALGALLGYIFESGAGALFLPVLIVVHVYIAIIYLRLFSVIDRAAVRQTMDAIVNN